MRFIRRHVLPWSVAFFVFGFLLLYLIPSFSQLPYLVDNGVQRVILTGVTFVMRLLDEALVPDHGCFVESWTPRETVVPVRETSPRPPEGFSVTLAPPAAGQPTIVPAPRRRTPQYPPGWPRG